MGATNVVVDCCDRCLDASIAGALNFRDLGGHAVTGGRVRRGLLYRSAMTHEIAPEGWQALADTYGLRTVIDLRSEEEIAEYGTPAYAEAGIAYIHAPVISRARSSPPEMIAQYQREMRSGAFDWTASYLRMVENGAEALRTMFETLAAPAGVPALFHCIAGRDRTGVAAALVLGVLGVSDEEIATDYALTGAHLRSHAHRFARQAERLELTHERMAEILETDAAAMQRFLDELTCRHGSIEEAVRSLGVGDEALAVLREGLVERAE